MSLQNRVAPTGTIVSNTSRGTLMGNRGVLHNSQKEVYKTFKSKAWITCLLEFKGRKRELMTPGCYTELFFFDEVTAFAAGHRPCAECRRARYNEFRDVWLKAHQAHDVSKISASDIDQILHSERMDNNQKKTWTAELSALPHGTVFKVDTNILAVYQDCILKWSFEGYTAVIRENIPDFVDVLTPQSVVSVFSMGFKPEFNISIVR